jgi:hypothetical protein
MNDDAKGKLCSILPIMVATAGTTTVTATSIDLETEFIFPDESTSEEIVSSLAYELGNKFSPQIKDKIKESVDIAKTYVNEFEFSITLQGIKLRISRAPKKTIKSFIKK